SRLGGWGTSVVDKCGFSSCQRQVSAYGLCSGHRQQQAAGKKLTPLRNVKRQEGCSFPACPREHYSKGYCQYHARQHREGKTLTPAPAWRAAASWKKSAEDRVDPETGKRWCTICKRWLSADQFGANRATADGVHYHCSRCASLARFSLTSIEYEQMLEAQ